MKTEKKKYKPYIILAVILLVVLIGFSVFEKLIRNPDPKDLFLSPEISDTNRPTSTYATEPVTETTTEPTESSTQTPENSTETERQTESKQPDKKSSTMENSSKTESSDTQENSYPANSQAPYEPPVLSSAPEITAPPTSSSQIEANAPSATVEDVYISPSTVALGIGDTYTVQVIYPPGLAAQGIDWKLDNNRILSFVSADVTTVTVKGLAAGTTYLHAALKNYNKTISCTVIVQ